MRTLAKTIAATACLALGALAVAGRPSPATEPPPEMAAEAAQAAEAAEARTLTTPAAERPTAAPARRAVPAHATAAAAHGPDTLDRRAQFDALPEAEQDARRTEVQDRMRSQLQADALAQLLALQAEVGMDDEQTRRAGALVDAEIDAILDLQQDAMDGVPPEELAGELLATFEATEAEAASFLEGDQLDAFIAMRRAG